MSEVGHERRIEVGKAVGWMAIGAMMTAIWLQAMAGGEEVVQIVGDYAEWAGGYAGGARRIVLDKSLKVEYLEWYSAGSVRDDRELAVRNIATRAKLSLIRYQSVARSFGMPWEIVAAVHMMESMGSFSTHLHNGDPLDRKTTHVPARRPPWGPPPYTWEESAKDALALAGAGAIERWDVESSLYWLESYNGMGTRMYHAGHRSAYLASWSRIETPGKYVEDGQWDGTARSGQPGCIVLLKALGWRPAKDVL